MAKIKRTTTVTKSYGNGKKKGQSSVCPTCGRKIK